MSMGPAGASLLFVIVFPFIIKNPLLKTPDETGPRLPNGGYFAIIVALKG